METSLVPGAVEFMTGWLVHHVLMPAIGVGVAVGNYLVWLCSAIFTMVMSAKSVVMGAWAAFHSTWPGTIWSLFWKHMYGGTVMMGSILTSLQTTKWERVCLMWDKLDSVTADLSSSATRDDLGFSPDAVEQLIKVRKESYAALERLIKDSGLDLPLQRQMLKDLGPEEDMLSLNNATILEFLALGDCHGSGPVNFAERITAMGSTVREFCRMPRLVRTGNKLWAQWVPVQDLSFKNPDSSWSESFDIKGIKDMLKYTTLYKIFIELPFHAADWLKEHVPSSLSGAPGGIATGWATLILLPLVKGLLSMPFEEDEFDKLLCSVAFNIVNHPQSSKWRSAWKNLDTRKNVGMHFSGDSPEMLEVIEYCRGFDLWSNEPRVCKLDADTPDDMDVTQTWRAWLAKELENLKGAAFWKRMKNKFGVADARNVVPDDKGKLFDRYEETFEPAEKYENVDDPLSPQEKLPAARAEDFEQVVRALQNDLRTTEPRARADPAPGRVGRQLSPEEEYHQIVATATTTESPDGKESTLFALLRSWLRSLGLFSGSVNSRSG
eukprot:TRINITY_DN14137_c0_g4_i1.p1 TRINITY_DN14137_c0_g4~~TRINITY_DN14137_c0_g4_i1.p1  ORF type:complete len:638 (-),score=57.49 TRINITY_DN14137_c0_g4_i1:215-1867(-)